MRIETKRLLIRDVETEDAFHFFVLSETEV